MAHVDGWIRDRTWLEPISSILFTNACGERVAMATQIGHITKVDADYGGNNHAIVSLWMRVPLEPNTEPSNANPAKGPMTDYMCKCGKKNWRVVHSQPGSVRRR
jgi:hypothetical protein